MNIVSSKFSRGRSEGMLTFSIELLLASDIRVPLALVIADRYRGIMERVRLSYYAKITSTQLNFNFCLWGREWKEWPCAISAFPLWKMRPLFWFGSASSEWIFISEWLFRSSISLLFLWSIFSGIHRTRRSNMDTMSLEGWQMRLLLVLYVDCIVTQLLSIIIFTQSSK